MDTDARDPASTCYYFVDEAGDGTIFDSRGRIIVQTAGCSRYFLLGLVDVPDPQALVSALHALRSELLSDPYFKGVPSMQPSARKTATAFHATDDLPEVRREVFALLPRFPLRFFAVVRDKRKLVEYVRQRRDADLGYRYHPNELYDYMVRRLFANMLHKKDAYSVCFARRGTSDRTDALRTALERTRQAFGERWSIKNRAELRVTAAAPADEAGLQAVDYFLWALQRLYERREDRYVALLWSRFRLVHDLDDTRTARYGQYYTQRKPLSLAAFEAPEDIGATNQS